MKRVLTLLIIFATVITMTILSSNNIKASKVDDFPNNLGKLSKGELVTKNGYETFSYQSSGNIPVFCTMYHVISSTNTGCTLKTDSWGNRVKAGVAAIIKEANINGEVNGMSDLYYYSTLAINQFLYNYNGQNTDNRISTTRSTREILGNYYYLYEKAVTAYNESGKFPSVDISLKTGNRVWNINSLESNENPVNVYKITKDNINSSSVKIWAVNTLPIGVTVKVYKSSDGTTFTDTGMTLTPQISSITNVNDNYIKLEVVGTNELTDGENFQIKIQVNGQKSYDIAENYDCGTGNQSVTPNYWKTYIDKAAPDTITMKVNTTLIPEYPNLKIVKIVKKDETTNVGLSNAKYRIQYKKEKTDNLDTISTKYTDQDGEIVYDEIEDGYYCIQEINAPDRHFLKNDKYCFNVEMATDSGTNTNHVVVKSFDPQNPDAVQSEYNSTTTPISYDDNLITITQKDEPNKITVSKTDKDGNPLIGAHLIITQKSPSEIGDLEDEDNVNNITFNLDDEPLSWDSDGTAKEITGLRKGVYYLYETKAPDGYSLNPNPVVIIITSTMTTTQNYTIKDYKTNISFKKVNIADETESLKGAHLQIVQIENGEEKIVKLNNQPVEWDSKKDEAYDITGLPAGTYYLKETKAPDGYVLMTDMVKFTINKYGKITVEDDKQTEQTILIKNIKNKIVISKKDITGEDELEGAYLQITDKNGIIAKDIAGNELKWKSGKTAKEISGLKAGTYILTETIAPDGYILSTESIVFTVKEDGSVTVKDKTMKDSIVVMTNEKTKVSLSKQDITTKEELPGATLRLFNQDDNLVEEWISGTEPHEIIGLPAGTYKMVEITSPDGYQLNEETITFTIDENGVVSGNTVMYNTPNPDVPNTLSTQSILITIAGIVIVGVGIGMYIYGIKKQKEI